MVRHVDGNDELTEVPKPGAADRKSVTGGVLMSEERGEALQKLLVLREQFARRFESGLCSSLRD